MNLRRIGILERRYKGRRLCGTIKAAPEDFIVEEIWADGVVEAKQFRGIAAANPASNLSGDLPGSPGGESSAGQAVDTAKSQTRTGNYTHFTLEKRNWDTNRLIKHLARSVGVSVKRFAYAGTKDKAAITAQRMSVWRVPPETLERIRLADCWLYDFATSEKELALGDHLGNRFTVVIRGKWKEKKARESLKAFSKVKKAPNFFGPQRFGTRLNSHRVGREMVLGRFGKAVKIYLTDTYNERNQEIVAARTWMKKNWGDFKGALERYPQDFNPERTLLHHLAQYPHDFANALRKLPRGLFKMFVHAYQGYLFNLVVSEAIKKGLKGDAPVFGYGIALNRGKLGAIEKRVLKKEKLEPGAFRIKSLPEASGKGIKRPLFVGIKEFRIEEAGDGSTRVSFSLPKGAYATTILLELGVKDE